MFGNVLLVYEAPSARKSSCLATSAKSQFAVVPWRSTSRKQPGPSREPICAYGLEIEVRRRGKRSYIGEHGSSLNGQRRVDVGPESKRKRAHSLGYSARPRKSGGTQQANVPVQKRTDTFASLVPNAVVAALSLGAARAAAIPQSIRVEHPADIDPQTCFQHESGSFWVKKGLFRTHRRTLELTMFYQGYGTNVELPERARRRTLI
ncbi:hypothetical protein EDB86DRAFT_3080415 [Lactarius hatsudake]|nr:hypothetical protein EDB86DRAFT_3080415 [Lactarius hatsudake]